MNKIGNKLNKICRGCLFTSDDLKYELKDSVLKDFTEISNHQVKSFDQASWLCQLCYLQLYKCKTFLMQCQNSHYILEKAISKKTINSKNFEDCIKEERRFIKKTFDLSVCHVFNVDWNKDMKKPKTLNNIIKIIYNEDPLFEEVCNIELVKFESKDIPMEFCSEKLESDLDTNSIDYDSSDDDYSFTMKAQKTKGYKKLSKNLTHLPKEKKSKLSAEQSVKKKSSSINLKKLQLTLNTLLKDSEDRGKLGILEDKVGIDSAKSKVKEFPENYGCDPSLVSVRILNFDEQIQKLHETRNSDAFKNSHFKCDLCTKVFLYENVMLDHQARHSAQGGEFCCPICNLHFSLENTFNKHVTSHSMQFTCLRCNKIHNSKRNMDNHLLMKHDQSDKSVMCEFCNKKYKNKKSLSNHIKLHSHSKDFKCHVCPKVFIRNGELHQHLLRHSGDKLYKCDICSKTFYSVWQMRRHQLIHSDVKEFYCKDCNLFFKTQSQLNQHLRRGSKHISPDLLKFPCTLCDMKFEGNLKLTLHMDRIHLKRRSHVCDTCSAAFYCKTGLDNHIKSVHRGFRNPRIHMCDICGKKFGTKITLNDHVRTHTGETPFECQFCKKKFKQHGTLYTHVKTVHLKKLGRQKTEDITANPINAT